MTADQLRVYVGAKSGTDVDAFVAECWATAVSLVDNEIGRSDVPDEVRERCYIEAGAELFQRKSAPNGMRQFAAEGGTDVARVARDPLVGVYPLLSRFRVPF